MAQFNDLLVLGKANIIGAIKSNADHDFLNHTNEFTFASPAYSGDICINHRTASGLDGNITAYRFRNGSGAETNVYASTFYGTFSGTASSATALTSSAGSTGQPVYFSAGKPVAIDWRIGNKDVGEHNANNVTYNFSGYYTSNGPATTLGAATNDGALWAQAYSSSWVGQIAQDYRDGGLFVRSKNNGTWTAWKQIPMLDGLSAGTSSLPVYVDAGIIKACGTSLAVSITGNAATATTATYIATSKASDNAARHVYFAYNGDSVGKQRVVVDDDFKYNPSTNTLLSVGLEGKKILLKDTATAGNGIIMYRGAATTDEALRINVDANNGTITNTNETLQSVLNLVLKYDDTSHTGAGAGSQTVVFKGTSSGSEITATKFNGALNGNASTASKWSSAKNFTIRDSYSAYSASTAVGVDGSGAVTLKLPQSAKFAETNTNLISGQAYPEGSSKYYHKVATISHDLSTSGQINTALTLLVTGYYGSCNAINGLLKAEMRWETDKTTPGFANLHWITASPSVTPENFILTYSITGTVVTVNLYVYMGSAWTSLNFTKLSEHNWGNSTNMFKWQFIKATKSATDYLFTAIPTTETQVLSVVDKIKNTSATADALTSSAGSSTRPVYFSSGKPAAISYLATAYGGTGVTSHTANRLVWSTSASAIQAGYHYANSTKVAINHTSEPSYNFQVNGTSHFAGNVTGSGTIQIKMAEAAIKTSIADGTNIVGLHSSTNRGLYDFTSSHWIIYKRVSDSTIRVPQHFYMDGGATAYGTLTIRNESSKPAAGTDIPLLKASYQNSGGSYYTTDVISAIGTGETGTTINNACLRIGSTSGGLALTAGESGKSMISTLALTNHENIDLITDAAIRTYVGCANDGTSYVKGPYITSTGITFYDTNEVANASTSWTNGTASTTEGTKGTQGYFNLTLGNATAISSTLGSGAGNSRGRIYMYGTSKYYTAIVSSAGSSHKTVTIPNYTGNMLLSTTTETKPTSATSYNIPFYTSAGNIVGYNNGFRYNTLEGTASATGHSSLYLGNSTASGTAGNQRGRILLYGTNDKYTMVYARPSYNANFYLPAGESADDSMYAVWNPNSATAVGGTTQPIYVTAASKVAAVTCVATAYGGTGNTSFTANRLVWTETATKMTAGYHYANSSKIGVNHTSEPSYNLYVNGTTGLNGLLTTKIGNSLGIKLGAAYITSASDTNGEVVLQGGHLRFGGSSWDYNVWAGLKYDSSSKIIYLGLADNSIFTANAAQSGGTVSFPGVSALCLKPHGIYIRNNDVSSYGSLRIYGGAKGGYEGIHFGSGTTGMTIMNIDGSHQGLYNQSKTGWIVYNNAADGRVGIATSSLTTDYKITLGGSTSINGQLYMNNCSISGANDLSFADPGVQEGITWTGGNGWWIYESPDDLTNAAGNLQFVHGSTRRLTINKDGYVDINARLVVRGNGSSYNEGIRILPASNGWSNIFFSANTTTLSDTHDGGWLIGRRGAAGSTSGAVGDFTIEEQSSNGVNLTIHKNSGGATLQGPFTATGKLTLSGTAASSSQIYFGRGSASYFMAATGGYYCFIPNGQETGTANADLIIDDGVVYPGTTNVTALGKSNKVWTNVYATLHHGTLVAKSASSYGTVAQRDALTPVTGQVFFVLI